jgi:AcrR family transcriptional regulator
MTSKNGKNDRRVRRTKQALSKALIELIREKHYDSITVRDVIERAGVGRSTFYTHFRDKEDLLMGDWEHALGFFAGKFRWENLKNGRLVPVEELFEHLRDVHPFYRALLRSSKTERLFRNGKRYLSERIEEKLESLVKDKTALPVPLPVLSNYLAGELFSQLKWWLDENMPHPPEEMDAMFHRLVLPGFRSVLENVEIDDG